MSSIVPGPQAWLHRLLATNSSKSFQCMTRRNLPPSLIHSMTSDRPRTPAQVKNPRCLTHHLRNVLRWRGYDQSSHNRNTVAKYRSGVDETRTRPIEASHPALEYLVLTTSSRPALTLRSQFNTSLRLPFPSFPSLLPDRRPYRWIFPVREQNSRGTISGAVPRRLASLRSRTSKPVRGGSVSISRRVTISLSASSPQPRNLWLRMFSEPRPRRKTRSLHRPSRSHT
jgi:hypothetical protein